MGCSGEKFWREGGVKAGWSEGGVKRGFLFWLSLAQLVSWGSTLYLFGMLVDPIEAVLNISRGQMSFAFGLAMLVEGACAYPVGRLIDAGHGRWVMTGGSLLACASLLGMSQITTLTQFYIAWGCLGAAMSSILYMPIFSIVTRRFPDSFRRAIIVITFLGGLASTVFIPLMAWLIANWGWSITVMVMAGFHLFVCTPIHWLFLKNEPASMTSVANTEASLPSRTRNPEQVRVMLLLGLFTALGTAMASSIAAHFIPLLRERGMAEFWVVLIPAAVGAIQVLGRMGILWSDGKFSTHKVNAVIVWLCPLGMLLLIAAGSNTALLLCFACVWGIGNGCQTIVKGTAVAQYVSHENVAALNGSLGIPTALARTLVPWGIGLLWTPQTGYGVAIWVLLGLGAIGAGGFMWAQRLSLGQMGSVAQHQQR